MPNLGPILVWSLLFLGTQGVCVEPVEDIPIGDFEGKSFGNWEVSDQAFSFGPARVDDPDGAKVSGVEGKGYASSNLGGYRLEGTLTSPPFLIERPYINFLLGGGSNGPIYLELAINGTVVKTAVPVALEELVWTTWNVSLFVGQTAQVRIVDDRSGHPEGYLFVDEIYQSADARTVPLATMALNQEMLTTRLLNPDLRRIPTLGVWQKVDDLHVSAIFPELEGFVCDSWCYEVPGIEFIGAGAHEGGVVRIEHRLTRESDVFRVWTEVIPTPGAVEFVARAMADPGQGEHLPDALPQLNLCFQLRNAKTFKSERDVPGVKPYPDFVKRCFIFTDQGCTFLNDTERRLIPARPATDPENNPPWVQMYVGVWKNPAEPNPGQWSDTSSDRYVVPVIGTVSKDGKHLVALAEDSADGMCQAWHDCLHTSARWQPVDAPPSEQVWRIKVYLMENDPDALLKRVRQDFPGIDELARNRVPLKERTEGEVYKGDF